MECEISVYQAMQSYIFQLESNAKCYILVYISSVLAKVVICTQITH